MKIFGFIKIIYKKCIWFLTSTIFAVIFNYISVLFFPSMDPKIIKIILFFIPIAVLIISLIIISWDLYKKNLEKDVTIERLNNELKEKEIQNLIQNKNNKDYNKLKLIELIIHINYEQESDKGYRKNISVEFLENNIFRVEYEIRDNIYHELIESGSEYICIYLDGKGEIKILEKAINQCKNNPSDEIIFISPSDLDRQKKLLDLSINYEGDKKEIIETLAKNFKSEKYKIKESILNICDKTIYDKIDKYVEDIILEGKKVEINHQSLDYLLTK